MIVFYFILLGLIIYGYISNRNVKAYNYLDKESCNAVKGVFIYMVFLSHIYPYISNSGYVPQSLFDRSFVWLHEQLAQLIVVMFLFYSGYGVMESIKRKGDSYIQTFPYRRIFITWINFAVAIVCFILLDCLLSIPLTFKQITLSFVCWDSVGNSNWYFFIILAAYIITYCTCRFFSKRDQQLTIILIVTFLFMLALSKVKPFWWYDTVMAYPIGMLFSYHKNAIEQYLSKYFYPILLGSSLLFFTIHLLPLPSLMGITHNLKSIFFIAIIICLTNKINICSKVLCWMGANLFPLYIYQRIPMIGLKEIAGADFLATHPYCYVLICAIITLIIAYFYPYWRIKAK